MTHTQKLSIKSKRNPSRPKVWAAIRQLRTNWTLNDLMKQTSDIKQSTIQSYVSCLIKGGYVACTGRSGRWKKYDLIRDNGIEAPQITNAGQPTQRGRCRENMWRTLHIVNRYLTAVELAEMASTDIVSVSVSTAKEYLRYLAKAGYVHRLQNRTVSYRMIRYTGPCHPVIQCSKGSVYDPNLEKIVWQNGAQP